ncbi:unnamed protein product [Pseudo-nitzschia multistriata]|uniref:Periplasmic binding protein domain-containing protein n=1 Tax=Pseudo-nitzschia multistriata TaxID=183589 RepID=A0A448ZNI3_9STRA|nr:unnamed protein product [Pseudo-nitzschia multistriata]
MPIMSIFHIIFELLFLFALLSDCWAKNHESNCDAISDGSNPNNKSCVIDRSGFGPIKVIVHGTKNDPFWQQVKAGMEQTARDMKVDLDLLLYDDEDPTLDASTLANAMVNDIRKYDYLYNGAEPDNDRRQRRRRNSFADFTNRGDGKNQNENENVEPRCGFGGCKSRIEGGQISTNDALSPRPAAMIVSLPGNSKVEDALRSIQKDSNNDMPIFGINALASNRENSSIEKEGSSSFFLGTVSMNETQAGVMAGNHIRELLLSREDKIDGAVTGLYVNHRSDVHALKERFDALSSTSSDIVQTWEVAYLEKNTTEEDFMAFFEGCRHTVIQLAGGSGIVESILEALVANGCNIEDNHIVGTFDTSSPFIYDAITEGTIDFAIAQQPYLQGSHAVLMAALYATTGQKLVGGAEAANIETGPILVTEESDDFPGKRHQICESEGYPVCWPGTGSSEKSECPCTDRSNISIAVVTHDESSDFWNTVFSGISQAATDFGISVERNRYKRVGPNHGRQRQHGKQTNLRLKHTFDINQACQSKKIDGLIVSLPDASMMSSLVGCKSRGIPYLALNALADTNQNQDIVEKLSPTRPSVPYVGQKDFESGFEAGKRLIEAGVVQGWCLMHDNFDTLNDRCDGMKEAFLENEKTEFMGIIYVPNNNDALTYKTLVETAFNQDGRGDDWSGYGILSTGREQIPSLLSLLEDHPKILAGTYDVESTLYKENNDSALRDQIIFGIDQNAYMEGYLSVATMVWKTSTSETHTIPILETGPNFVSQTDSSSSQVIEKEEHWHQQCRDNGFRFCESRKSEPPPIEERPLTFTGKCSQLDRKCGVCEGDCDDDTHCGEGLVCFVRDSLTSGVSDPVPGCSGNPIEWSAKDFCVDARLYECKDVDVFEVRVGNFSVQRTCSFVELDKRRCSEYGRLCRATCGYCRKEAREDDTTAY